MTNVAPQPGRLPPWGVFASAGWVVLAFVIAGIASALAFGVWRGGGIRSAASNYDGTVVAFGLIAWIPVVVLVLAGAVQLRRWTAVEYLALGMPRRAEVIVAVLALIALDLVFLALLALTGHDIVTPFQIEAYRTAKEAGWLFWLFVAIVLFAPVGEEIAFRGFLYRGWALPGRERIAVAAIAFVWALLHIQYDWLGMLQIFVIGLMLGWFRWVSGSTTLTILMHALINLEAMLETAIKVELFP
jgi:membrane protease YdiL (CAAX protease family)